MDYTVHGILQARILEWIAFPFSRVYGLLKYNIRKKDLATLSEEMWGRIVHCGIDLASEVCQSYDNYISKEFASNYRQQS